MTAVYKGVAADLPPNSAMPLVREFIERKRLAKLGFTTQLSGLRADKAHWFILIDSELDRLSRPKSET